MLDKDTEEGKFVCEIRGKTRVQRAEEVPSSEVGRSSTPVQSWFQSMEAVSSSEMRCDDNAFGGGVSKTEWRRKGGR